MRPSYLDNENTCWAILPKFFHTALMLINQHFSKWGYIMAIYTFLAWNLFLFQNKTFLFQNKTAHVTAVMKVEHNSDLELTMGIP